jgi:hypothetical protein
MRFEVREKIANVGMARMRRDSCSVSRALRGEGVYVLKLRLYVIGSGVIDLRVLTRFNMVPQLRYLFI